MSDNSFLIREALPEEFARLGQMLVQVYASLPGMPSPQEQPEYYGRLQDVRARAGNPAIQVFLAARNNQELLGCVDFIEDMQHYGSGGTAATVADAAGIRLLAVKPECRQMGIGRALTAFCIQRARDLGKSQVILHTTRAMGTAWNMYERMGFERFAQIDFRQASLEVFGFSLRFESGGAAV